jgi:hypothetical protein
MNNKLGEFYNIINNIKCENPHGHWLKFKQKLNELEIKPRFNVNVIIEDFKNEFYRMKQIYQQMLKDAIKENNVRKIKEYKLILNEKFAPPTYYFLGCINNCDMYAIPNDTIITQWGNKSEQYNIYKFFEYDDFNEFLTTIVLNTLGIQFDM